MLVRLLWNAAPVLPLLYLQPASGVSTSVPLRGDIRHVSATAVIVMGRHIAGTKPMNWIVKRVRLSVRQCHLIISKQRQEQQKHHQQQPW